MYLPATKDEFLNMSRHEHNLKLATDNVLLEYCKLKVGRGKEVNGRGGGNAVRRVREQKGKEK